MTAPGGYSSQHVQMQRVSIQTVDPVAGTATARTRYTTDLTINTDYHVGAVHVTPAIGEQWYVRRVAGDWVLDHKVSFNTTVKANVISNPVSGTYQIGSSGPDTGPLLLLGSHINAMAPLKLFAGNSPLPDAATVDEGSLAYDDTAKNVVFSDGTVWVALSTTSGAGTAYVKPSGGIPATDMTSAVQAELTAASTAYQKPSGGIPVADLDSTVQADLTAGTTALHGIPNASVGPTQLSATGTASATSYLRGDNTWDAGVATTTAVQTLSNKTLAAPTITGFTETVQSLGTLGATKTLPTVASGTMLWGTLTSATACTVTMPTAAAGLSFLLAVRQPASGTPTTATFTGVKWSSGGAPTLTATVGKADVLSFFCYDGTNWYGSYVQGFTY